ncbi:CheR family methyltransferase [Reichenbachiella ulvae]|uniref:Protein-glutamate O-methyltransferase CheR n=1 Tax=Reichenbachiella ulvae TaxID=2980104 RepID=A0ABT3CNL4_9BACT|nr:protein-glutamate O-methyltransferase CheR [Reichenbachiella ulvae]MCV9385199.1 protein-glutamate O-methyltransferase CheR [Reichenbachiella ulvae]
MVTEEEVKAMMIAMKKRYDLDFTNYESKSLSRGIVRLMTKHRMNGMADLWGKVLQDDEFFLNSIDDLLVNLTELFRNPDAWLMIKNEILPQFKFKNNLDIWHAGCSTGEEVCTMAIVLEEVGQLHKSRILASDLSRTALSKAKAGCYSNASMRNYGRPFKKFMPNRELEDFFNFSESGACIKQHYIKNVEYKQQNLVECEMDRKFDVIFCRNVLIYFDGELKTRLLSFFESCLKEDGYLILGYYDTMPNQSIDIFDIHDQSTRIYKKKVNSKVNNYEKDSVNC